MIVVLLSHNIKNCGAFSIFVLILAPSETDNVTISLITHLLEGSDLYCTLKTSIKKEQGKTT